MGLASLPHGPMGLGEQRLYTGAQHLQVWQQCLDVGEKLLVSSLSLLPGDYGIILPS